MLARIRSIFATFGTLLIIQTYTYAAPTRSSVPTGLFPAIDNPVFFNDAVGSGAPYGPHLDKFYDQTGSEQTVFAVTYNLDDAILMYSLRGAKFVSIVENANKTQVTISFSPYINFGSEDNAIYIQLFTASLFDDPAAPSGLKDIIKGAYFDSKLSHYDRPPILIPETSEDYSGYPAIQLGFDEDSNDYSKAGGARMFFPAAVLNFFGAEVTSSDLFLKRFTTTGSTLFYAGQFDTAQSLNGGALYDLSKEASSTSYGWKFELSKTPKAGLQSNKKKYSKNDTLYLRGYVKGCTKKFTTSLESRDSDKDEFKKLRKYDVYGCEFNAILPLKKSKEFRFKYKNKYFARDVKVTSK
jgi:hypothetical protein